MLGERTREARSHACLAVVRGGRLPVSFAVWQYGDRDDGECHGACRADERELHAVGELGLCVVGDRGTEARGFAAAVMTLRPAGRYDRAGWGQRWELAGAGVRNRRAEVRDRGSFA